MRWQTSRTCTEEMLNKPCSKSNRNHHHCAVRSPVGKSKMTLKRRWAGLFHTHDTPGPPPFGLWPESTDGDVVNLEITQQEVKSVMQRMPHQSAPGLDYVTNSTWREVDPSSSITTRILDTCRRSKRIPSSWKNSTTILIHKGDDPIVIKNWHPISLQNTIYKLYIAVIGKRLSSWAQDNNIFSWSQKGFSPVKVA